VFISVFGKHFVHCGTSPGIYKIWSVTTDIVPFDQLCQDDHNNNNSQVKKPVRHTQIVEEKLLGPGKLSKYLSNPIGMKIQQVINGKKNENGKCVK